MAQTRNKSAALNNRQAKPNIAEAMSQAANAHILRHYPFGCLGGTPRRLLLENLGLWFVPVFLTSPGIGPVGEVGVVAVDEQKARVVGYTEQQEVAKAVQQLKESKGDEREAAF